MNEGHPPELVEQVLRELEELRDPDGDPELEAVKAAVLLEDSLDVTLSDDDIDPQLLSDPDSVAALVERRREGLA
jgi:hypothetical protein